MLSSLRAHLHTVSTVMMRITNETKTYEMELFLSTQNFAKVWSKLNLPVVKYIFTHHLANRV